MSDRVDAEVGSTGRAEGSATDRTVLQCEVDGVQVELVDRGASLLDVLRDDLGVRSAKDGCSPQGQCGCCTVLVDGSTRVACVTPARRVVGRRVTTLDGLEAPVRQRWAEALAATGGTQCGFCTPGIIVRLEGLRRRQDRPDPTGQTAAVPPVAPDSGGSGSGPQLEVAAIERALQAHLCRCTGWRTVVEAARLATDPSWPGPGPRPGASGRPRRRRDPAAAARRAALEGGWPQQVGPEVAQGRAGFAADTAPPDALVAVPTADGGWAVAESLLAARQQAAKVQGRRTTVAATPPLARPDGDWAVTLRTSWVEPGYLEPDASWCRPGGQPASPLANGGAFGGKAGSEVGAAARRLADQHGRSVLAVFSREDVVRQGPKRPPVAVGMHADGSGVIHVVRTAGIAEAIALGAPDLEVVEHDVAGPPTSADLRGAGWVEAAVVRAVATGGFRLTAPGGGWAEAQVDAGGALRVRVGPGQVLDEIEVTSYATGAAHQALSWVTSEALAVDPLGAVQDLTIRSFGILRACDTPPIHVEIDTTAAEQDRPPVAISEAVLAAVAACVWRAQGLHPDWPTGRPWPPAAT